MQADSPVIEWLLQGDPSIRWQVLRDIIPSLPRQVEREQGRLLTEGWCPRLLSMQDGVGCWGGGLYSPKWISTTYTMLLLRRLGLPADDPQAHRACTLLLEKGLYRDGGINFSRSIPHSETCMTGMVLSVVAYFRYPDSSVERLAEHLLGRQMPDGGWNCESYRGATHSSFHTTINVLEGLREYEKACPGEGDSVYRSQRRGWEFLLEHRLFKSHRTGKIVDPKMLLLSFPPRWRYDILRVLDYFAECRVPYDSRMDDALAVVERKRRKDGLWPVQNKHPGIVFFDLERTGKPSRWNTLRALRVLKWLRGQQG